MSVEQTEQDTEHHIELLTALQERLGYTFGDLVGLVHALTHRSYANETNTKKDNQRLEYLGDAVLDMVVSAELYHRYPKLSEGRLSYLRSRLVREESLAERAEELALGPCLLLGKGEDRSGGRDKASLLADAFEAVIAAIYIDGGYQAAYDAVLKAFGDLTTSINSVSQTGDHKTRLQEIAQARWEERPKYTIVEVDGPPHARTYTAVVSVDGKELGTGSGCSKKAAQQDAARAALGELNDTKESSADEA
jgi:ribonuclease III